MNRLNYMTTITNSFWSNNNNEEYRDKFMRQIKPDWVEFKEEVVSSLRCGTHKEKLISYYQIEPLGV